MREKFIEISDDIRFQYFYRYSYREMKFDVRDSTWLCMQQVCISNGKLIEYFACDIDRDSNVVTSLQILNFTLEPSIVFAKDLSQFLRNIFDKYKHRKLRFTCIADNPILPSYKRLCMKFGGRVVGIHEKEDKLLDGEYHDLYLFEILRDNYLKKKLSRCKHGQADPLH